MNLLIVTVLLLAGAIEGVEVVARDGQKVRWTFDGVVSSYTKRIYPPGSASERFIRNDPPHR
ncbi:MAG: hypothetical protein HY674_15700 [Chloroflexi bacterium]|nr:hypothetical protein [Chloroflexota bacterium]